MNFEDKIYMNTFNSAFDFMVHSGPTNTVIKFVESKSSDVQFLNFYLEKFLWKRFREDLEYRDYKVISSLLKNGADPMFSTDPLYSLNEDKSCTLLDLVIKINDFDLFHLCLPSLNFLENLGFDPKKLKRSFIEGNTPLHIVVTKPCVDVTRHILSLYVDVHAKNKAFETPLMLAVQHNQLEQAKILLKHGAKVKVNSYSDDTVLHRACYREDVNLEMVELLLDAGCDPNAFGRWQLTPLQTLAKYRKAPNARACAELLIRRGANVNSQNRWGDTALHTFVENCEEFPPSIPLLDILLKNGADIHPTNQYNQTFLNLLMYCCEDNRWKILKHLILLEVAEGLAFGVYQFSSIMLDLQFEEECRKELDILQFRQISKSQYTLLSIFSLDEIQISRLCKNSNLRSVMSKFDEGEFPIYGTDLRNKYLSGLKLYFEVEEGLEFITIVLDEVQNYYAMMAVIKYISIQDLVRFGRDWNNQIAKPEEKLKDNLKRKSRHATNNKKPKNSKKTEHKKVIVTKYKKRKYSFLKNNFN